MRELLAYINPWITMGILQVVVWVLVIAGILALRHHHDR